MQIVQIHTVKLTVGSDESINLDENYVFETSIFFT